MSRSLCFKEFVSWLELSITLSTISVDIASIFKDCPAISPVSVLITSWFKSTSTVVCPVSVCSPIAIFCAWSTASEDIISWTFSATSVNSAVISEPSERFCTVCTTSFNSVVISDKMPESKESNFYSDESYYEDDYDDSSSKYGDYNGWDDDTIDEAFDGNPELTWNID